MPEALARAPRGPVLTAPVRDAPPRRKAAPAASAAPAAWRRYVPKSKAGYAGFALAAAMIGIVVNAVVLQRERHPAPFFAGELSPPPVAAPAQPPAPVNAQPKPTPVELAPPAPVARPTPHVQAPAPAHREDLIGDLLKSKDAKEPKDGADSTPTIAAVQRALVRAGYVLKADGKMGGDTEDALHEFEKAQNLPISNDLSPKLLAKLGVTAH